MGCGLSVPGEWLDHPNGTVSSLKRALEELPQDQQYEYRAKQGRLSLRGDADHEGEGRGAARW